MTGLRAERPRVHIARYVGPLLPSQRFMLTATRFTSQMSGPLSKPAAS
jgi:hypothetical protein